MKKSLKERFDEKWMPEPNSGCWLWTGATNGRGYGQIHVSGKTQQAHCVAKLLYDDLPLSTTMRGTKMAYDHLCRTGLCVNPRHIELVTFGENTRRGAGPAAINAKKTHCKRGHEFNEENTHTYFHPERQTPERFCRPCRRLEYRLHRREYYRERWRQKKLKLQGKQSDQS